jgi:pimeloyl-ACP methyl ester carboxylesterase
LGSPGQVTGGAMSLRRVAGPAGTLSLDDGGRGGVPVLFTHSLTGDASHWSAQLEHLRGRRRTIALDLRAHGRSDPPPDGDYDIRSMARDIAAAADALDLERFVLVGHSMGAGVAMAYAGAHPERIDRLMLVDSIGDGTQLPAAEMEPFLSALESPSYQAAIEGYWATIWGPNPAVAERLLRDLRATSPDTVVGVLKATATFDPKPSLAAYGGPALAVITPANNYSFSMHRLGAGMPHHVVEGTGHWLQLDKPEEMNQILNRFLE